MTTTNRRAVPGSDVTTDAQKEIISRFCSLEEPLLDAVAWAGIVAKLVEHDLAYWPRLSKGERNSVAQQFSSRTMD
jgi:hypothetical protein